jgi:molybdenum cofactor cytidylyltransferase
VGCAAAAGLGPVLVVLGHESDAVRSALAGLSYEPVFNPSHAEGQGSSLRLGVSRVPPSARAAVVLLADMPLVTAAMVRALVDRYDRDSPPLVVSRYGETAAPPILYDASLFPELQRARGEGGGRDVIARHAAEAASIAWPEEALQDMDRPEDYERLRAR